MCKISIESANYRCKQSEAVVAPNLKAREGKGTIVVSTKHLNNNLIGLYELLLSLLNYFL